MEITEISNESSQHKQVLDLLRQFDIHSAESIEFVDSSHGEDDIRHNYIIDKKYVLRINSAKVMTEKRLTELNTLIERYRSFGMKAPVYLKATTGNFVVEQDEKYCYLSEYLDYPVADDVKYRCREDLIRQRVIYVARFAQAFKDVDLVETVCMFSIFDLSPYDQLSGLNIDEKQENLEQLVADLKQAGYEELAKKLNAQNEEIRNRLKPIYKDLPRCVFQGDLNPSNELHKDGHFAGLIDFNLSGTDVNINVFLNETNWFPEEAEFDKLSVPDIVAHMDAEQADTLSVILRHYAMNDAEKYAFPYYKRIIDLFQYPNVCEMVKWLKEDVRKDKCVELIQALVDKPM